MPAFLELEAYLGGEFIHPGAIDLTRVLIERLDLRPRERALELGAGTGATAALIARETGARLVAVDRSAAMLSAARARLRREHLTDQVALSQFDAGGVWPFGACTFDVVYAESAVALMNVEAVLEQCVRVLRPGGRLILNERIWRSGLTQMQVDEINALSRAAYGIPASTALPIDYAAWLAQLQRAGFVDIGSSTVDALLPSRRTAFDRAYRWRRVGRYLRWPQTWYWSLKIKRANARYGEGFAQLISYLFWARKPE